MDVRELRWKIIHNHEKEPENRYTQTIYNTIQDEYPEVALKISGTSLDPTKNEYNLKDLWQWLERNYK